MERARIVLADDHAELLAMAVQMIESQPDLEVIKTFNSGQAIVDAADELQPDLFVLDISMPGVNGIDAAVQLMNRNPNARIVFLTVHDDQDYFRSALATGALGYIIKCRLATDLVPALRHALAGRSFVSQTPVLAGATERS